MIELNNKKQKVQKAEMDDRLWSILYHFLTHFVRLYLH